MECKDQGEEYDEDRDRLQGHTEDEAEEEIAREFVNHRDAEQDQDTTLDEQKHPEAQHAHEPSAASSAAEPGSAAAAAEEAAGAVTGMIN